MAKAKVGARLRTLCWRPNERVQRTQVIDSTGIYSLKNLRHLDRGSDELDRGRYEKHEYVMWGATGAAAH
jgi:hypothetical protein